jgi:hypothetical protein
MIYINNGQNLYKIMLNILFQMKIYGIISYYKLKNILINIIKDHQRVIMIMERNNWVGG